jgi:hypothetical protein
VWLRQAKVIGQTEGSIQSAVERLWLHACALSNTVSGSMPSAVSAARGKAVQALSAKHRGPAKPARQAQGSLGMQKAM